MKTLRYNNGKWRAANNDEDSKRTQAVDTIQYVQWSRFLTFQLSPELFFNPENSNMVHGLFCFWFDKRWVVECLEGSIWKMSYGKQSRGKISLGCLGKAGTNCHGCGPARFGGLYLKQKMRVSIPCELHEVWKVIRSVSTELCNCVRFFPGRAPSDRIRKTCTSYITQELGLCL